MQAILVSLQASFLITGKQDVSISNGNLKAQPPTINIECLVWENQQKWRVNNSFIMKTVLLNEFATGL